MESLLGSAKDGVCHGPGARPSGPPLPVRGLQEATPVELDNYSRGVVCIQTRWESGRVQTPTRSRSAVRIDLRRPFCWQSKNITFHRGRSMSVDNLARGQRTMLSTAEPGTPARVERMSQRKPTPQGTERTATCKPHRVHLNLAVRLSKGWGPPLIRATEVMGRVLAKEFE